MKKKTLKYFKQTNKETKKATSGCNRLGASS